DTLLHLDLSPQEQQTCVEGIAGTTERLAHLVQQILEVTRIEDGRLELHCEPVRLVDVIRRAITGLPRAAHPSRIRAELAPGLPPVWADPQRLEEVVINVLDNALKYSPPSAPVQIQACADGATVRVEIQDWGIGIPPEEHEFLFRKFQRAANARQLQIPGTGLGLFICRSIIEAHGGRIALESAPARGTRIAIWLPIAGAGAQG
ncbi:MAG: ATP-binding protein, partial [Candidatus Dormibacteraeota bacterium]|nr:ATP-binding protein [Candidatus Dormibacteraeota bacterium]